MCRSSLPGVFWGLFLFSFASSSFHPTSALKTLIRRDPCSVTGAVLLFLALLDAFDWQLLSGLMLAPLLLVTFLLYYSTRVFFCLPVARHALIQASNTSPQQ